MLNTSTDTHNVLVTKRMSFHQSWSHMFYVVLISRHPYDCIFCELNRIYFCLVPPTVLYESTTYPIHGPKHVPVPFIHDNISHQLRLFCWTVQLRFATVDLELHTRYIPGGSESIYDVDQRISQKTQVIPPLPEDRFLCSFSHIFAGLFLVTLDISLVFWVVLLLAGTTLTSFLSFDRWLCCWVL